MPTLVSIPFGSFGESVMPAPAQIVGLQWQVNSSSGACTVELRLDDIAFIPAVAPPEPAARYGDAAGPVRRAAPRRRLRRSRWIAQTPGMLIESAH